MNGHYQSSMLAQGFAHGAESVEEFMEPLYPPAPCRTIVVTEQMRQDDARLRAERDRAEAVKLQSRWPLKRELSLGNLRTVRRAPVDERLQVAPTKAFVVAASTEKPNVCRTCKAEMSRSVKTDLCMKCLPPNERRNQATRSKRIAAGRGTRYCQCGGRISNSSRLDQCGKCRDAAARTELARRPKAVPVVELVAELVAEEPSGFGHGVIPAIALSPVEVTERTERMPVSMDALKAEVVKRSAIPKPKHKIMGRTGEIWRGLKALGPDEALKVHNRDAEHAQNTSGHVKLIGRKAGREIVTERHGTDLYIWFAPVENAAAKEAQ